MRNLTTLWLHYLLLVYAKARKEDLSTGEKRAVRKLAGMLKA